MDGLRVGVLGALVALSGCGLVTATPGGAPLVSAQFPPGTGAVNSASEPQPLDSLPPGAANVGPGTNAVQPNTAAITFGAR